MWIDEKIALLEKESRLNTRREFEEKISTNYDPDPYPLETVKLQMKLGRVWIISEHIETILKPILSNTFQLPFLNYFFSKIEESEKSILLEQESHKISINITSLTDIRARTEPVEWLEELQLGMLEYKLHTKVTKVNALEFLDYICYTAPTAEGIYYNIAFRLFTTKGSFFGTLNCKNKDRETIGILLEAIVHEIDRYQENREVVTYE